jgi:hypothetical protein
MFNVDSGLLVTLQLYIQGALNAFLPLITAVIGLFIAFAIARMLQFYIKRMIN